MQPKHKKLARRQLDETLSQFRPLKTLNPPTKGWIRAIRETLGMTGEQLARRLQTNRQRVSRIEQDEIQGKLTLTTLRNAAAALDCTLVYGIVPRRSLEQTIQEQALGLAQQRIKRSNQMMRLEKQELSQREKSQILQDLVKDIVDEMPKALWEEC
jgi:predicted DNA-binding mobile mystery protein A